MHLPRPITILGFVQLFAGLVILIDPLNTVSRATIEYFGGIATPLFIGIFTAFCGMLILYARYRGYHLASWKRTLLAAPILMYCATIILISRNALVILIVFLVIYFIVYETGYTDD